MEPKHYITDVSFKALIVKDNAILFVRETNEKGEARWELPGGRLHEGETVKECIDREMQEELGIKVKIGGIFDSFPFTSESGKNHFVSIVKMELADTDQIPKVNAAEIDEVRWVTKDDVGALPFWAQYKELATKFFSQ